MQIPSGQLVVSTFVPVDPAWGESALAEYAKVAAYHEHDHKRDMWHTLGGSASYETLDESTIGFLVFHGMVTKDWQVSGIMLRLDMSGPIEALMEKDGR